MENKEIVNKSVTAGSRKDIEKKKEKKENQIVHIAKVIAQFFRDAKMEIKKVKWPTRKELLASTIIVLVFVIILGLFLGLIDFCLMWVIKQIV